MKEKDRIKAIVSISLFTIIGFSYWLDGKSTLTKTVVAFAVAIWFGTMYYLRKK